MTDSGELRARAISSLKAKQSFWYTLTVWVVLSIVFLVVWFSTGAGYFWPVWPIAGIAIGVVVTGIHAFGGTAGRPSGGSARGPSEARIQDEMRRLS